jgi:putative PEP-CTERM system histidine kinase
MSLNAALSLVGASLGASAALLALWRHPRGFVHRVFALGMGALGAEAVLLALAHEAPSPGGVLDLERWRALVAALLPGIWLLFSLSFARDQHREFLRQWRWVIAGAFAAPLALAAAGRPWLLGPEAVRDPETGWVVFLGWAGSALAVVAVLLTVLVLMNLERTLRAATGHGRWQLKFMVLAVGGLLALRVYTGSQALLFHSVSIPLLLVHGLALIPAAALIFLGFQRARVMALSLRVSHSVLQGSVTLIIVGAYFLGVGLLAKLLLWLDAAQDLSSRVLFIFLALCGLMLLLLSDRVRYRTRRFVARHFHRSRHDYRRIWSDFSRRTAALVDPDEVCREVAGILSEAFEALAVHLWMAEGDGARLRLAASTAQGAGLLRDLEGIRAAVQDAAGALDDRDGPADLADPRAQWALELMARRGEALDAAGIRYCVRLAAGDERVGLISLGKRVSDAPMDAEDMDLLKTLADQTAATLLNRRLAERLRQAREMEAFQSMSAFMLHDLKNLGNKLSLTAQNFPVHFENPDFRRDAARVMEQSVEKIKGLCGQLALLRQTLELSRSRTDLNALVRQAVGELDGLLGARVELDLGELPPLDLDRGQLQKALVNLIANANDAVGKAGEIRVSTRLEDGAALLSVCDNGCGIPRAFLEKSLFRAFRTTKKQGMGIGLFHAKAIVEAHDGRIEVESEEGKGSRFRIVLPLESKRQAGER